MFGAHKEGDREDLLEGRRVNDAALEGLVEITGTASGNRGGATAAVKSADERPRRDRRGLRVDKPHGPRRKPQEEPRRDNQGRRLNKPHDPRARRTQRR